MKLQTCPTPRGALDPGPFASEQCGPLLFESFVAKDGRVYVRSLRFTAGRCIALWMRSDYAYDRDQLTFEFAQKTEEL